VFSALTRAGGKSFSDMVVGYDNVNVDAAMLMLETLL